MVTQIIATLHRGLRRAAIPLLIIIGVGTLGLFGYYYYQRYSVPKKVLSIVRWVRNNKADHILQFIERQILYNKTLAYSVPVTQALTTYAQEGEKHAFDILRVYLEEAGTAESYQSCLLISRQGNVIFSNFAPEYVGVNVFDAAHKDSPLGSSIIYSAMAVTYTISRFLYDPVLKKPAMYMVVPVFNNGVVIGYFVQLLAQQILNDIFNDYLMLGDTGDAVIGVNNNNGVLLISESKRYGLPPFKHFINDNDYNLDKEESLLIAAVHGGKGEGIFTENEAAVSFSWQYIPLVNWGVVIAQPIAEFLAPYAIVFTLATLLAALFIFLMIYKIWCMGLVTRMYHSIARAYAQPSKRILLQKMVIASTVGLLVLLCYFFIVDKNREIIQLKNHTEKVTQVVQEQLQQLLDAVERVANVIANDLGSGALKYADVIERLKRELKDNPDIYGITVAFGEYKFSKDKRLYGPYVMRKGDDFVIERYEDVLDYTRQDIVADSSWAWYVDPIKANKSMWFDPYWEHTLSEKVFLTDYSLPFYAVGDTEHREPIGVINVSILFDHFQKKVEQITLGNTGYGIFFGSTGMLLYYPQEKYVAAHQTIMDVARGENDKELFGVIKSILAGQLGFHTYTRPRTIDAQRWLYAVKLPSPQWYLCTVFSGSEAKLSTLTVRHYCIAVLILLMILAVVLCWRYTTYLYDRRSLVAFFTALLAIGLMLLLLIIRMTPVFELPPESVVVSDQTHINKYVHTQQEYARNTNESIPVPLYFGLYITSIEFKSATVVALSGYLWQRITDPSHKELLQEIQFLQAINEASFTKVYERTDVTGTLVCWRFFVDISRQSNNAQYPLDPINLAIRFEHSNFAKNVILAPLVENYTGWESNIAGLKNSVNLSGFQIIEAFFVFNAIQKPIRFGVERIDSQYGVQTTYQVSMIRKLMYDFIVFILPLLIIYFLLYTIIVVTAVTKTTKELFTLSAYTGLIFVAVLLHRALRSEYQTGGVLYLEYLFFLLYVSFIIIVLYTSLDLKPDSTIQRVINNLFYLFKNYFWPIQLTALFIITVLTFYPQ